MDDIFAFEDYLRSVAGKHPPQVVERATFDGINTDRIVGTSRSAHELSDVLPFAARQNGASFDFAARNSLAYPQNHHYVRSCFASTRDVARQRMIQSYLNSFSGGKEETLEHQLLLRAATSSLPSELTLQHRTASLEAQSLRCPPNHAQRYRPEHHLQQSVLSQCSPLLQEDFTLTAFMQQKKVHQSIQFGRSLSGMQLGLSANTRESKESDMCNKLYTPSKAVGADTKVSSSVQGSRLGPKAEDAGIVGKRVTHHLNKKKRDCSSKPCQTPKKRKQSSEVASETEDHEEAVLHSVSSPRSIPLERPLSSSRASLHSANLTGKRVRGVTRKAKSSWQAQCFYNGKSRYIGLYDCLEKAALAYEVARDRLQSCDGDGAQDESMALKESRIAEARVAANLAVKALTKTRESFCHGSG